MNDDVTVPLLNVKITFMPPKRLLIPQHTYLTLKPVHWQPSGGQQDCHDGDPRCHACVWTQAHSPTGTTVKLSRSCKVTALKGSISYQLCGMQQVLTTLS